MNLYDAFLDELQQIKVAAGGANIASLLARRMGHGADVIGAPMQAQALLQAGKPAGLSVLNKVHKQFPTASPKLASPRSEAIQEIAGLGTLAIPSIDHLQAVARARLAKDSTHEGVEKRRFLGDTAGHAMEVGGLGVLAQPYFKQLKK